ncbi:MAG: nitroreductase family protein [Nannocystaceae bacterium]
MADVDDRLAAVRDYHRRTKHHGPGRYARSLGYLDWDSQPDPFRRFEGAALVELAREDPPTEAAAPRWPTILRDAPWRPSAPLDAGLLGRVLYHSLALSAWKEHGPSRWSLRVNPSSGNLHPTEGYVVAGAEAGLTDSPGVYHYRPFRHALERRAALPEALWRRLVAGLPRSTVLVGLTSILWREAWKYGERAFRYCNHDVGHAIAALTLAAACEGWRARLVDGASTAALARLLRVDDQEGIEAEHAECLLALFPADAAPTGDALERWTIDEALGEALAELPRAGAPNQLSEAHHEWPLLAEIAAATEHAPDAALAREAVSSASDEGPPSREATEATDETVAARVIIRQRRSAVAMDGRTGITAAGLFDALRRLLPATAPVAHAPLPWAPAVDLALFVHRVADVDPGLYVLVRDPARLGRLRAALDPEFDWARLAAAPDLPLYRLRIGDARRAATYIACTQEIAGAGCFAVAMLADLDAALAARGPSMYRRLYWECGLVGQLLYLEAEALGIRGTGIGCYFDDRCHDLLGLGADGPHQALYWFTVGGPLEDERLRTRAPYFHLDAP